MLKTTCPAGYSIRLAEPDEIDRLSAVEQATAALFPEEILPARFHSCTVPREMLATAQSLQNLWVSLDGCGQVVGFALLHFLGNTALLAQIDVLQKHGRKGLGRGMIACAAEKAAAKGYEWLYLTTFRTIPWNEPFYRKLGFAEAAEAELPPVIAQILREERTWLTHPRLAMRLALVPDPDPGSEK